MEKRLGSGKTGATKRISRFAEPRARWRLLLKTETLGPCKILAHIPLKKKKAAAAHLRSPPIVRKFARPVFEIAESSPPPSVSTPSNN